MSNDKTPTTIRCAIYTRKSTEEGLDQDFNSLDAQRESAENYIASQKGQGWVCLPDYYDDDEQAGGGDEQPARAARQCKHESQIQQGPLKNLHPDSPEPLAASQMPLVCLEREYFRGPI